MVRLEGKPVLTDLEISLYEWKAPKEVEALKCSDSKLFLILLINRR